MAAEYLPSTGALYRRYVFGPGVDEPIVEYDGSGVRTWMMADERGSIVARPNDLGNMSTSRINSYDEYGIPGSSNSGRFQYTGQMWVPELGMYFYKARAYSPTLGRFLQTDPIGYGDGMNDYAYTHNDPVNGSDPWGLEDFGCNTAQEICVTAPIDYGGSSGGGVSGSGESGTQSRLENRELNKEKDNGADETCQVGSTKITDVKGNVNISGNISFPDGGKDYITDINNAWTGQFGDYNVVTNLSEGPGGLVAHIANCPREDIPAGRPCSDLGGPNMYLLPLNSGPPNAQAYAEWSGPHEFGHAGLNLPDQYADTPNGSTPFPGSENDIMGAINGTPSEGDISDALLIAGILGACSSGNADTANSPGGN